MHDLNIMHKDIKCANVFMNTDGTVKIGDMNLCKVKERFGQKLSRVGTPCYASPEVWNMELNNTKSDIWSLGCILYKMINIKLPFLDIDNKEL